MKQDWSTYKSRLEHYGYTEEQLEEIEKVRNNYEHMTFEQFRFLFLQGVIKRTVKLKKPRNLFVSPDGEVLFLSHYHKKYNKCGHFITEENEE